MAAVVCLPAPISFPPTRDRQKLGAAAHPHMLPRVLQIKLIDGRQPSVPQTHPNHHKMLNPLI